MTELPGAVRFIYAQGDEGRVVGCVEGGRRCSQCARWHAYDVGLIVNWEPVPSSVLLDSFQEAAAQVGEWLPDGPSFRGRREPEDAAEASECLFASRQAAIGWLLEAT